VRIDCDDDYDNDNDNDNGDGDTCTAYTLDSDLSSAGGQSLRGLFGVGLGANDPADTALGVAVRPTSQTGIVGRAAVRVSRVLLRH
jgi:hypothetical protein